MLLFKKWNSLIFFVICLQFFTYHHVTFSGSGDDKHVKIEKNKENGLARITLTPKAAERLDIQTIDLKEELIKENGENQKTIPYSAVLYDTDGNEWAYTSPEKFVYIRHPISIEYIEDDKAVLSEGPPVGTSIVTIGVMELYGVEKGIGK